MEKNPAISPLVPVGKAFYRNPNSLFVAVVQSDKKLAEGWFPLGVDCRRGVKNSLILHLVLCAEGTRFAHKTK